MSAASTPRRGAGDGGRLSGEVAVVSGSTSGLGAEIARRFGTEGAKVVVTGRSEERGQAVADQIGGAGGEAAFLAADLTSEEECGRLIDDAAEHYGSLTVLVNNAVGSDVSSDARIGELSTQTWEGVLRVALTAVVWLCRAAIPHMERAGHGSIVNISSRAAERATPGLAAYTAAKGGLNALTRSVAADYAEAGIRCNTLSPGYILHERRDADLDADRRHRLEGQQLTRLTEAADVASAAVYLAGRESEVVTGILLPVDGGSTVARAAKLG